MKCEDPIPHARFRAAFRKENMFDLRSTSLLSKRKKKKVSYNQRQQKVHSNFFSRCALALFVGNAEKNQIVLSSTLFTMAKYIVPLE